MGLLCDVGHSGGEALHENPVLIALIRVHSDFNVVNTKNFTVGSLFFSVAF